MARQKLLFVITEFGSIAVSATLSKNKLSLFPHPDGFTL